MQFYWPGNPEDIAHIDVQPPVHQQQEAFLRPKQAAAPQNRRFAGLSAPFAAAQGGVQRPKRLRYAGWMGCCYLFAAPLLLCPLVAGVLPLFLGFALVILVAGTLL